MLYYYNANPLNISHINFTHPFILKSGDSNNNQSNNSNKTIPLNWCKTSRSVSEYKFLRVKKPHHHIYKVLSSTCDDYMFDAGIIFVFFNFSLSIYPIIWRHQKVPACLFFRQISEKVNIFDPYYARHWNIYIT